nr:pentatricopeptide repeat-containing protein At5g61800 [Ipomoea batatas]
MVALRPHLNRRLICKQSWRLITILKLKCNTISHIHQVQAQAVTRGCLSTLNQTPLLTQILHSFTSLLPLPASTPSIAAHLNYATAIFNLIRTPSSFCYNTVIRSHALLSSPTTALGFFSEMQRSGVPPDSHTFPFVLKACASLGSSFLARALHCQALRFGFLVDVYVVNNLVHAYCLNGGVEDAFQVFDESCYRDVVSYNVMIDGFVKAGETGKARELFDEMPVRDTFSWGALIAGYAKMGKCRDAINLFDQMLDLNFLKPCNTSLVSALSACSQLGELEKGMSIHNHIKQNGVCIDAFLATGLVDMYAKCGCIEAAREVFETCSEKNLFTWNAMLVGLAMHGHGKSLLDYFSQMVASGTTPDGVTFLGVLVGCSHAGIVDEARKLFGEMESIYGVPRELKHYGCMADLLGRAGLIKEAMEMIERMPMKGDVFVWGGLLGGCRTHGNVEVAEKAAERVMEMKPEDGGAYSILANVYANTERWDELVKIRRMRDGGRSIKKNGGCSLIHLNDII